MQNIDIRTIAIACIGIAVLIMIALWIIYKKSHSFDDIFDDMDGEEFEEFCAELLEKKGYENVELTGKSHDKGVDIFADKNGVSYAIQCKCYSEPVGIKAVQEVYAGKDYYCCMVAVVMTNQSFTKSAIEFASRLNVLLWDGDVVSQLMIDSGTVKNYQIVTEMPKKSDKRGIFNIRKKSNTTDTQIMEEKDK